jgi:hypothetical protein
MGTAYTNYLNYWASNVGTGFSNINNLYDDMSTIGSGGAWGLLESPMQAISPVTSAPYKWQAAYNYAH